MNRLFLRSALIGGTVALLSTCVAALAYGAFEMGTWSPAILIYAPLWQSLFFGLSAGVALGWIRPRLRLVTFVVVCAITGAMLGFIAGELGLGDSPHYSRNVAMLFLAAAWSIGALSCASAIGLTSRPVRSPGL